MSLIKKLSLAPGEEIIIIARQHPAAYFWHYFFAFALLVAVAFFSTWLMAQGTWGMIGMAGTAVLAVYLVTRAIVSARANWLAITTAKIVAVRRTSPFNEEMSVHVHDEVDDLTARKKGVGAGLFDYGEIIVHTAASAPTIVAENIGSPQLLLSQIKSALKSGGAKPIMPAYDYDAIIELIPALTDEQLGELEEIVQEEWSERERDA